jgi:membrane protein YdbS with pleckstrin-like domain
MFWVPLFIGALVLDRMLLTETVVGGLLPAVIGFIGLSGVIVAPDRIYRRLGYAIDGRLLRTVRGWLFHTDTVVPFVRVQHIDVTRGPVDKMFGTASLVVHTAGTHNSVVVLPGLSPDRAAEIREAIRGQIRADAE